MTPPDIPAALSKLKQILRLLADAKPGQDAAVVSALLQSAMADLSGRRPN